MMIKTTIAVLLAVAAGTAVAQQAEFVAGMLSTVPLGYALASLADLQSADFLNQYNSVGINYVQPPASGALCCAVSVQEGFLSIGPSDSYSNYLQPFLNGAATCTSGSQPTDTTFGIPLSVFGPYEGMWISNLTTKEQVGFRVTGVTPTGANFNDSVKQRRRPSSGPFRHSTLFRLLALASRSRPVTPWRLLQTCSLPTAYNKAGGVVMTASDTASYCCILSVAEGWLGYNDAVGISPLGLFSESFDSVECGIGQDRQLVCIGTSFGGPNTGLVFDTFNTSVTSLLGTFSPQNSTFCHGVPASQTLLKRVSTSHHKYIVQVVGTNYPAPPTSQYTIASIAGVQSQDFLDFYNTNGGLMLSALDAVVVPERDAQHQHIVEYCVPVRLRTSHPRRPAEHDKCVSCHHKQRQQRSDVVLGCVVGVVVYVCNANRRMEPRHWKRSGQSPLEHLSGTGRYFLSVCEVEHKCKPLEHVNLCMDKVLCTSAAYVLAGVHHVACVVCDSG